MNYDVPKFTIKIILASVYASNASFEDSEKAPKLEQLNIPQASNSDIRKQASRPPCNPLHPLHVFISFVRRFTIFSSLECQKSHTASPLLAIKES